MPFGVGGRWAGALVINGKEILVSDQSIIEMSMKSGLHRNLPSATVVIDDKGAVVTEGIRPDDGMMMDIMMSDGKGGPVHKGAFRILGKPIAYYTSQGVILKINGLLDAFAWSKSVVEEHFQGPSSGLFHFLGGKAGLAVESDFTSDSMTWLPNRKPLVKYASFAASHGWAGPTSCMIFSVNTKGVLRYRDVNSIFRGGGGNVFGIGGIKVHQFHAASKAANYNSSKGYGSTTMWQGLDGKIQSLNKIAMSNFGGGLSFSGVMQSAVGSFGSMIESFPIDCGNVFKKYYDAPHQNERIKATYGNDIHILVRDSSSVYDLDHAVFNCMHPITGALLDEFSGQFIVTNIVRTIKKGLYSERITLTNQG